MNEIPPYGTILKRPKGRDYDQTQRIMSLGIPATITPWFRSIWLESGRVLDNPNHIVPCNPEWWEPIND